MRTLLKMWPATGKAARLRTHLGHRRASRILIHQMRVLCPTSFAKVSNLHDLGQHRYVHSRSRRLRIVVFLKNIRVLVERALVPVLLQKLLLAFRFLLP